MIAYIDGGSRGNPGSSGIGVVLDDPKTGVHLEYSEYIGIKTNNQAEYSALIKALQLGFALGTKELYIFSDSELVVKQMHGEYECKSPGLQPLHKLADDLRRMFVVFAITHVPREQNGAADRLANEAMDRGTVISV